MSVDLPLKMCEKFIDFASQLMMVADPQPPNVNYSIDPITVLFFMRKMAKITQKQAFLSFILSKRI